MLGRSGCRKEREKGLAEHLSGKDGGEKKSTHSSLK